MRQFGLQVNDKGLNKKPTGILTNHFSWPPAWMATCAREDTSTPCWKGARSPLRRPSIPRGSPSSWPARWQISGLERVSRASSPGLS
eukprot:2838318-Pyramimonas_sp.AAC.1